MSIEHKLVAILNKELDSGIVLNALGHMALGLGNKLEKNALCLDDYQDNEGNIYPRISQRPFIILRGTSTEIRKMVNAAREQKIEHGIYVNTMTGGTYKEQLENTQNTPESQLIYYGCVLFGPIADLTPLTKRFSLWR